MPATSSTPLPLEVGEIVPQRVDPAHGSPAPLADVQHLPARVGERHAIHERSGRKPARPRPLLAAAAEHGVELSRGALRENEADGASVVDAID
ncbi:MAG: hypothetical protein ACHQRL_04365, partial [Gemmatimonadales bacterium]